MLLSRSRKLIFIKTVKTASSSVQCALAACCDPRIDTWTAVTDETGVVRILAPTNDEGWATHASASDVLARIGSDDFGRMLKIGVVRDPFDFAISLYWWEARNGPGGEALVPAEHYEWLLTAPQAAVREDFTRWLRNKPEWPDNLAQLSLSNGLAVDVLLKFESIHDDMRRLFQRLGVAPVALPIVKGAVRRSDLARNDYFDAAAEAMIRKRFARTCDACGY